MNNTTNFSVSGKIKQIKSDGDLVYVEFEEAYIWPQHESDVVKTFSDEAIKNESERRKLQQQGKRKDKYGTIRTKPDGIPVCHFCIYYKDMENHDVCHHCRTFNKDNEYYINLAIQ